MSQAVLQPFLGTWRMVPAPSGEVDRPHFTSASYVLEAVAQGLRVQITYADLRGVPGTLEYVAIPETGNEPSTRQNSPTFHVDGPSLLVLKSWILGRYNGPARWELREGGARARVTWANSEVVPGSPDLIAFFERI